MNTEIAENFQGIRKEVPPEVVLIAVSKAQPADAIEEVYRLGHRDFGENYVQELVEKAKILEERGCSGIRWHFIGHLQTNKVKQVLAYATVIHSVDSLKLATEISTKNSGRPPVKIFIEINIDEEESKSGVALDEAIPLSEKIAKLPNLSLQGLMCVPRAGGDSRAAFDLMRDLERGCQPHTQGQLSMGMTQDFRIALEEGATHVRIGTAIFGRRGEQP